MTTKNKKSADPDEEEGPKEHEPLAEPTAAIRLKLAYPEIAGERDKKKARIKGWELLREAKRQVTIAAQCAVAEAITWIREARRSGRSRFPGKADREASELPPECFDISGLHDAIRYVVKSQTGFSEYWYAEVMQAIISEFNKKKLAELLKGDRYYPDLRKIPLRVRGRSATYTFEEVKKLKTIIKDGVEQEIEKIYMNPVIETPAFFPGGRPMRFVMQGLHGKGAISKRTVIEKLALIGAPPPDAVTRSGKPQKGRVTKGYGVATGWHKGSVQIIEKRRPGEKGEWFVVCPYSSPTHATTEIGTYLVVHRGVRNALVTLIVGSSEAPQAAPMTGSDIVETKRQFFRRRTLLQRSISTSPHRGRGRKAHYKALRRLGDAHARYIDTAVWRLAKFVETQVKKSGATHVIIENFSKFPSNSTNHYVKPYVRQFPIGLVKARIIDVCTRRAAVKVIEHPATYNMQTCPACEHVARENIVRFPSTSINGDDGEFRCAKCQYAAAPDQISILNLALASDEINEVSKERLRKQIAMAARFMRQTRKETKKGTRKTRLTIENPTDEPTT